MKALFVFLIGLIWLMPVAQSALATPPVTSFAASHSDSIRSIKRLPLSYDSWTAPDKFDHLLLSAMLSSSTYLQMKVHHNEPDAALAASLGLTLTLGVGKELYDVMHPGHPSWKDLAADALGALIGALVARSL